MYLRLSSLVKKFAVDPECIFSCCCDTWRSILFLTVGFIGTVRYAVVSPGEDGSVCRKGPANVLALSPFICPSIYLLDDVIDVY